MEGVIRDTVSEEMVIVMAGAAKMHLGELVEIGLFILFLYFFIFFDNFGCLPKENEVIRYFFLLFFIF